MDPSIRSISIESTQSHKSYLQELLASRELCYFLAWRDLKIRYKQAAFGVGWALIRPLMTMLFFTLIFSNIAHLPSDNVNYPLLVLAGMMIWQLVTTVSADASAVLLNQAPLITKIYFPRMVIPISVLLINFFDFFICYAMFVIGLAITQTPLHWSILASPLLIGQAILLSLGLGLWCSALTVRYRDFRFVVILLVQFSLLFSPVGYSSSLISTPWNWFYPLNPLVGIIDGLRWATFQTPSTQLVYSLAMSWIITVFLIVTGYLYFRRVERNMADIL